MVIINKIVNTVFCSVTYILSENGSKDCWLIDCGDIDSIIKDGWKVKAVLLTHCHFDHIYGLNSLIEEFPEIYVYTNEYGFEGLCDPRWNFSRYHPGANDFIISAPDRVKIIKDGDHIQLGGLEIFAFETPGHDPSCVSYIVGNQMFTGDSYIPGVKVVSSFPKSNKLLAENSYSKLFKLSSSYFVRAGHYLAEKDKEFETNEVQ